MIKYDIMHSISHSSPKYFVNVVKGGVAIVKGIKTLVHYNENLYLHFKKIKIIIYNEIIIYILKLCFFIREVEIP